MRWLDPHDAETYRIQDQFAIGNDVIVAPVVTRGATTRDVYLTEGQWVDAQVGDPFSVHSLHARVFATSGVKLPAKLKSQRA